MSLLMRLQRRTLSISLTVVLVLLPALPMTARGGAKERAAGARFLLDRDPHFHLVPQVEQEARRIHRKQGTALQKPIAKVSAWLDRLDFRFQKIRNAKDKPRMV